MKNLNHYAIALLMQRQATEDTTEVRCMLYCIWEKTEAAAVKEAQDYARQELMEINLPGFEVKLVNTIKIDHTRPR